MTKFLALCASVAFAAAGASAMADPPTGSLSGTEWRLVRLQSAHDSIGTIVPPHVELYTLQFLPDGRLLMRLDCNRAVAQWRVQLTSPGGGTLAITLTSMTRARCTSGALDVRIAGDAGHVRSFTLSGTSLTLAVDGGIYTWEPLSARGN